MKKIFKYSLMAILLATYLNVSAADRIVGSSAVGEDFTKIGAAGSQFLKIGLGARASAMGGAYGSISDDLTAVHWNPAGLAQIEGYTAEFAYNSWFAGWQHIFAGLSLPINENYTVAVSIVSFQSDQIPITTTFQPEGSGASYRVSDFAGIVSFSGYLTDQFSFGINAKIVNNAFTDVSASTLGFDIGTMYATGYKDIKLGFSIHNLGDEMAFEGQQLLTTNREYDVLPNAPREAQYTSYPFSMPLIFRASISAPLYEDNTNKVLGAFDFITTSDMPEQFIGGAEWEWNDLLFVRAGYIIGNDQQNVTFGAGFKYLSGGFGSNIDYAIQPTNDIGWIHRLNIGINLGS